MFSLAFFTTWVIWVPHSKYWNYLTFVSSIVNTHRLGRRLLNINLYETHHPPPPQGITFDNIPPFLSKHWPVLHYLVLLDLDVDSATYTTVKQERQMCLLYYMYTYSHIISLESTFVDLQVHVHSANIFVTYLTLSCACYFVYLSK